MNKRQLRDIVKQDNARRAKREAEENAILFADVTNAPEGIDPYHWGRSITGIPSNNNRNYKASDDCWKRGMRGKTVGVAPGTENATTGSATVAITRDGVTTVVPVSNFSRKSERTTKRVKRAAVQPETARVTLRGMDWSQ